MYSQVVEDHKALRYFEGESHTLQAVAVLGFLPDNVEDRVDELGAFRVMPLGPVVPSARLAEDEVVRPEDLADGPGSDGVHGARLQIHEHGAGDVATAARFVVVDVDPLELEVRITGILTRAIDTMLIAYHLPELGPNLVPTLAALNVENLPHLLRRRRSLDRVLGLGFGTPTEWENKGDEGSPDLEHRFIVTLLRSPYRGELTEIIHARRRAEMCQWLRSADRKPNRFIRGSLPKKKL
ncbi:hypothetical protein B296_00007227 [Ensete ventricosum]|uniref:Uncharacterized protein n=1 Tax=Ensete ventricosum TaxID=4639 RepID=A0A427ACV3_ENSVE|nr:hypothetical protein B296_00007227 [Ensete ventricosum]